MAKEILYQELVKDFRVTEDGRLFRLMKNGREKEVQIKPNQCDGYCQVKWKGKVHRSHRLMYCLYHQKDVDVDLQIDHENGVRIDNSKKNLSLANNRDNSNNKIVHRNGKLQGCHLHKCGKYRAQITINGKKISLGLYQTELEAHEVYKTACTMLDKSVEEIQEFFGVGDRSKYLSKYVGVTLNKANSKWVARPTTEDEDLPNYRNF